MALADTVLYLNRPSGDADLQRCLTGFAPGRCGLSMPLYLSVLPKRRSVFGRSASSGLTLK